MVDYVMEISVGVVQREAISILSKALKDEEGGLSPFEVAYRMKAERQNNREVAKVRRVLRNLANSGEIYGEVRTEWDAQKGYGCNIFRGTSSCKRTRAYYRLRGTDNETGFYDKRTRK